MPVQAFPTLMIIDPAIELWPGNEYNDAPDDCSTSSTFLVEKPKRNKRVCFSPAPNQYIEDTIHTSSEIMKDCWFTNAELNNFRSDARETTQRIIAVERRNHAPFSYRRVLEQIYDVCTDYTSEPEKNIISTCDFEHLVRWLAVADSRFGLDKNAIRKISFDKIARRLSLRQTVFSLQSCGLVVDDDELEQYDEAEYLREECESLSLPNRLYARIMAEATAAAVQQEECFIDSR